MQQKHFFRTYPTLESCKEGCWRSNEHRDPIKLRNGRWAAMTYHDQWEYERRFGKLPPQPEPEKQPAETEGLDKTM